MDFGELRFSILSANEQNTLRQYLLGQQPVAELSQVEERLMIDSTAYEELLILEDELVDEYIRGRMTQADRADFENNFLRAPEHRAKLRFARALSKHIDLASVAKPVPDAAIDSNHAMATRRGFFSWPFRSPAWNYALAVAVLLFVVGTSWLAVRGLRERGGPGKIYAVTLTPGGITRSDGEIQAVAIPPGTDTVRFELVLPSDQSADYSARLVDSGGRTIAQVDGLKPIADFQAPLLNMDVPVRALQSGQYRIGLRARSASGFEGLDSYTFRIP